MGLHDVGRRLLAELTVLVLAGGCAGTPITLPASTSESTVAAVPTAIAGASDTGEHIQWKSEPTRS